MTRKLTLTLAAALACFGAATDQARADGLAGAYLAGRQALMHNDFAAAAPHLSVAVARDPQHELLLESMIATHVALGDVARAVPAARAMLDQGFPTQTAHVVILADQVERGAWEEVLAGAEGRNVGPLIEGLVVAWAQLGLGRMSEAVAEFDRLMGDPTLAPFAAQHKALALASAGDFEGAEEILRGAAGSGLGLTRRGVQAHVQVLSQLDRVEEAQALLAAVLDANADPVLESLQERLADGEVLPFTIIQQPADGVAEVFYSVAMALAPEDGDQSALLYARLASHDRPAHTDAILLSASLLESMGQYDLATAAYNRISRDDPAYDAAELGRAEALYNGGRVEAAIEVMEQLARARPDLPLIHIGLGDMLRREGRHAEAIPAYDRAIALIDEPSDGHWALFYSRGISHEREGNWPEAEADFRSALDLRPDQPLVLNYLGYSYVERNENLDEALGMIERAVAARPEDGFITDSLGWVLYRLGRYEEAVEHMERAVELTATDPIINDHLGDVYWAVGRRLEAEFQWRRALSFKPEPEEERRIRRKLDVGLDAVLAEEGAPPLRMTMNGN
ncbi:tetratricopeptide repeat protein [Halodurantibacterium flavum]|uniref:Tetratricopeptide repeat protein n=1 Tax=Halodurantibacterium flavum TaxID=1382802 RepID=A0ABW4S9K2_9RHOB